MFVCSETSAFKTSNYNCNITSSFGNWRPFSSHGWEIVLFAFTLCNVLAKWWNALPPLLPPYPSMAALQSNNQSLKTFQIPVLPPNYTCWYLLMALKFQQIFTLTQIVSYNTQYLKLNQTFNPHAQTHKNMQMPAFESTGQMSNLAFACGLQKWKAYF